MCIIAQILIMDFFFVNIESKVVFLQKREAGTKSKILIECCPGCCVSVFNVMLFLLLSLLLFVLHCSGLNCDAGNKSRGGAVTTVASTMVVVVVSLLLHLST